MCRPRSLVCAALVSVITLVTLPGVADAAEPRYEPQEVSDAHVDQVERLYRTTLGREADEAGAQYWAELLAQGFAIERLAELFLASEEYQMRTSGDHVIDAYVGALERDPEQAGYQYWSQFDDATVAVIRISDSREHQLLTSTLPPPERTPAYPEDWVDAGHGVYVPSVLLEIRWCESRDDYTAANTRSSARGAYQFLSGSWAAYGHAKRYGVRSADRATPAQQDEAAVITWERSGTRPWNASRHCWN